MMELDEALETLIMADPETIENLEGPGIELVQEIREEAGA